jgi:hypothetical protein
VNTHSPTNKDLGLDASELIHAIQDRGRIVHVFDVANIFGVGGKPVHQIAMQILPSGEDNEARDFAKKSRAEQSRRAGAASEDARKDPDALALEVNLEALFRICLRVDKQGKPTRGAAFPGVAWMRENLTTDELATLINLVDEMKIKHGRVPLEIDDEKVEAVSALLAEHVNDEIPEQYLAPFPRWWVTHFAVLVSSKLAEARKSVDILLQEREANKGEREALEAEIASLRAELAALSPTPEAG